MNKEEILNKYIDLIDKGYCCDCNELNCIDNFPHTKITRAIRKLQKENKILKENAENNDKVVDKVNWENMLLKKENEQLKGNWTKLKEWLEEMINEIKTNDIYDRTEYECTQITTLENVLAKLEEIEGGMNI